MGQDARVRYTKKVIKEVIISLLQEKPFHKITLTEVCRLAEINRTTFYKHYRDLYDWKEQLEDECLQRTSTILEQADMHNMKEILTQQFRDMRDNAELSPHTGYVSNKTLFIALNYQERTEQINAETLSDILDELDEVKRVQNRLTYYVSILAPQQEKVIRRFYFESISWEQIAEEVQVALRTVHKIKNRAFDKLAEFYDFSKAFQ